MTKEKKTVIISNTDKDSVASTTANTSVVAIECAKFTTTQNKVKLTENIIL